MREYNDYVQTTREYLKRYHEFKATIENLNDEIEAQEELLKINPSAPVPKYGDDTGGGKGELTPVESEASKRIEIQERIEGKKQEVARIERAMRKVDRALEALPDQERSLVEGYYFQHKRWMDLANELFVSEKWASKLANKVVKRMAGMIFGTVAAPGQQSLFVFFE